MSEKRMELIFWVVVELLLLPPIAFILVTGRTESLLIMLWYYGIFCWWGILGITIPLYLGYLFTIEGFILYGLFLITIPFLFQLFGIEYQIFFQIIGMLPWAASVIGVIVALYSSISIYLERRKKPFFVL